MAFGVITWKLRRQNFVISADGVLLKSQKTLFISVEIPKNAPVLFNIIFNIILSVLSMSRAADGQHGNVLRCSEMKTFHRVSRDKNTPWPSCWKDD